VRYPFRLEELPKNGIYFFYENGEVWGHGGEKPRIVRVGTHRQGNFRSRIADHYLLGRNLVLDPMKPAPKDRSIFRKNLGRAILKKRGLPYLDVWDIDFTSRKNREENHHLRNMRLEVEIEEEISRILRENFFFKYIVLEDMEARIGEKGLESKLIATLAQCPLCKPSEKWLGNYSPVKRIRTSGLWLYQHLDSSKIQEEDKHKIVRIIDKTKKYKSHQ
jgi:hypothetical protein